MMPQAPVKEKRFGRENLRKGGRENRNALWVVSVKKKKAAYFVSREGAAEKKKT